MRPDFLLVTTVSAALIASLGGLAAETSTNKEAGAAFRQRQAEEQRVERSRRRGWMPVVHPLAAGLREDGVVEVLTASEPLRMRLEHPVRAAVPRTAEVQRVLEVLDMELRRYPAGLLRQAGLHRIVLCAELADGRTSIPSLPNVESSLLLDVVSDAPFLRRLIHHEVYHFIDFSDDRIVRYDAAWSGLNPRHFVYAMGGRHMRDPAAAQLSAAEPGFLTRYATSALEEDKAEVFSYLMSAPDEVAVRAVEDDILRAKVKLLREQLVRFSASADDLLPRLAPVGQPPR